MTRKMFRLTARADGHDKPLYISMVQAFDADEARGYCHLPMPYTAKGPVTWDMEEVTIRNEPPPREDAADAAVRILSAPPDTVARVEGETKDETIDRLHKALHERNQAWAWERRERERAVAAEAGWKAQRDAALADVETLKREILAVARQAADLNKTTEDQRDRALALLREDRNGARERDGRGWSDRRRALLAEVGK